MGTEKKPEAPTTKELTKDPASLLVLVNRENALDPANYKPKDLRTVAGSDSQLRDEAATALESLLKASRKDSRLADGSERLPFLRPAGSPLQPVQGALRR